MSTTATHHVSDLPIVHRKRWGSWALGIVFLALIVALAVASLRAKIIDFAVFREYIFSAQVLIGTANALVLGTLALFIAGLIGFVSALMRVSGNPILSYISAVYVYLFRGTPMLIQLIFWFNAVPIMFPNIYIALPFTNGPLVQASTTAIVTPFLAALAGLSLAEGAYMSEIIRGGILAVDKGQREAATALGMVHRKVLTQVIIPQAGRIIIPAAGNQYIMLLKSSSLASAIGYLELLRVATDIYSSNFRVVELLAVTAVWYLVMTAFATGIQMTLEKVFPSR